MLEKPDVRTDVVAAGEAKLAMVAVQSRLERGAVARRPTADTRSNSIDRARGLVAQNHGIGTGDVSDAALGEVVHIRTAYAH